MKTLIVALLAIATVALLVGCQSTTGGTASTQPTVTANNSDVQFFVGLGVDDLIAASALSSDPAVKASADAALKAKADLDNANPADPEYRTISKALNDAAFTLALDLVHAKVPVATVKAKVKHPTTAPAVK